MLKYTCRVQTLSEWQLMEAMHLCWPILHNLTVPSLLADKHCVPSLFTVMARILSEWPLNLHILTQFLGSQIRNAFSGEPDTKMVAVGFIAIEYMLLLVSLNDDAKYKLIEMSKCGTVVYQIWRYSLNLTSSMCRLSRDIYSDPSLH